MIIKETCIQKTLELQFGSFVDHYFQYLIHKEEAKTKNKEIMESKGKVSNILVI